MRVILLINYDITSSNNHVKLSSTSGNIAINNQNDLNVNISRENLPNGKSYSKLYFNINNKKDSIVIGIDNFKEEKLVLNTNVVDAEYLKSKDQLIYVSANPSKINIYNTNSGTTESISLSYTPTCVSISQNGATAVVGHDGHITYVNLNTKSIIDTYNVSCFALDIVLGNNKWAYVFPKNDQWEHIRCVNMNLSNDNETYSGSNEIYAGTKARLHPSGKYIYGANNGLSPSNIEKYDIQNGVAVKIYSSPYHGNYPMSGNLWFSEDGNRIFTRGRTVLRTSEIQNQDMLYNGTINPDSNSNSTSNIEWLDHSVAKNNLYAILSNGDYWTQKKSSYVYVYNSSNLDYKRKIELEKFLVSNNSGNGTFYDAEPYFVFSNSARNNLFAITKATGAGLDKEWAIQKIAIE